MKYILLLSAALTTLAACEQQPRTYTVAQAKAICEDERRDAQGPRSNVTLGANSESGGFANMSISLNDSFIRGEDPDVVYSDCMSRLNIVDASGAIQ